MAALIFEVEVVLLRGGGQEWTPLAVGFGHNFVGWRGGFGGANWVDAQVGSGDGEVGEGAVFEAGDEAGDGWGGDRRDLGGGGCGAGDELVHLGEGGWVEGEFAVVEVGEDDVGGSNERRAFVGNAGGGFGFAEGDAAGLGVLVELVAAEGHHLNAGWDFGGVAVAVVEGLEVAAFAVEFAVEVGVHREHAVIWRAAGDCEGDVAAASVEEVVADGHAATAAADESDFGAVGFDENAGDEGAELGGDIGGGGAILFFDGVVGACVGVSEADGEELVGWVVVRLEEPDDADPLGGVVAVAVDEDDGDRGVGLGLRLGGSHYGTGQENGE